MGPVPLTWYLIVAAALFCIGAFGALARRNAVAVLMGVELMLNAVNINLIAFWRYLGAGSAATAAASMTGQVFAIFVITVAAAEAAVGLALIIAIYRQRSTVVVEDIDTMKG
jgi:NADH-quinone oxidoreductase subunit K